MQSDIWGTHLWEFLHTMCHDYPLKPTDEHKKTFKMFIASLTTLLPCCICRKSFTLFYNNIPIDAYLNDRQGVIFWMYIIHNIVNLKLGKRIFHFINAVKKYEQYRFK